MTDSVSLPAFILAGGRSERMGFPKAKLSKGSIPILRKMAESLNKAGWNLAGVVIGERALEEWILRVVPGINVILNRQPEQGGISSLRLALEATESDGRGLLAWPVDHPLIEVATLAQIRVAATLENVVIPTFNGRRGHPTWWGRASWELLKSNLSDQGANRILKMLNVVVVEVPVKDCGVLINVDTPEVAAKYGLHEGK